MTGLKIVVLEQFFVLQVAIFSLDSIELVAKSQVVFIALLNLKDFSLELGDE